MKKHTFYYFREFGELCGIDCSTLTLKERLFLSCILTKARAKDTSTFAELLFGDLSAVTRVGFKDFDKLVTDTVMKSYGKLFDYIIENAPKRNAEATGEDRYSIHAISIDTEKLFLTKNGMHGKTLAPIAWKAFALAAAASKSKTYEWRELNIFSWMLDDAEDVNSILKVNKTQLKRSIQAWLKAAGINGEFRGDRFIVDCAGYTSKLSEKQRGWSKESLVEKPVKVVKAIKVVEPIEEASSKPVKAEELFDDEELTAEEKAAEEEWLAAESGEKEEEEPAEEVEEVVEATSSDTLTPEQWVEWYDKHEAEYDAAGKHKEWASKLRFCSLVFNLNAAKERIAKAFGMKGDALEKFIATRYVDDKVGGFETKKKLCKAFKELQNRVFLRKDDDSWTGGDKELGDIFVAYACKAHRFMRETF